MLSDKELEKRVKNYLSAYGQFYNQYIGDYDYDGYCTVCEFLMRFYKDSYKSPMYDENIMFQMFSAIKAFDLKNDPYFAIAKDISKKYDINCDVLEICSGYYPALSKYIDLMQRRNKLKSNNSSNNSSSITTCDLNLIDCDGIGKIRLCRGNFEDLCDFGDYKLVIAKMPAGKMVPHIIREANRNHNELYLIPYYAEIKIPDSYYLKKGLNKDLMTYDEKYELKKQYIVDILVDTLPEGFSYHEEYVTDSLTNTKQYVLRTKNNNNNNNNK